MDEPRVTVAIPVGPESHHLDYLEAALISVRDQTWPCRTILVNDMNNGQFLQRMVNAIDWSSTIYHPDPKIFNNPWRLGVAASFNVGVGLAETECVILLGADDTLEPQAAEVAIECYERERETIPAYYGFTVRYMDTGDIQHELCGGAMVTKTLWRETGGFPTETASGASDAAFLSQIWNRPEVARRVLVSSKPLYNYRRHNNTDTAARSAWQGVILETRNLLTEQWRKPTWLGL